MITIIRQHKWTFHWVIFAIIVLIVIIGSTTFPEAKWLPSFLQIGCTLIGIHLTLIIFLQSKEDSDKQFVEQLRHLQELTNQQILQLQQSTQSQIEAMQSSNTAQIHALQEVTEKQIENLQKLTYEEISAFEANISEVVKNLTDNSILLAEILGRELEKALAHFETLLNNEKAQMNNLSRWKILRTAEERDAQLRAQANRINKISEGLLYLRRKYDDLKNFMYPKKIED